MEIILIMYYCEIHTQYISSSTLIINIVASITIKQQEHSHINTVCNQGKDYS